MMPQRTSRTRVANLTVAFVALCLLVGCNDANKADSGPASSRGTAYVDAHGVVRAQPGIRRADSMPRPTPSRTTGNAESLRPGELESGQPNFDAAPARSGWSIALFTNTGNNHQALARQRLAQVHLMTTELRGARVHSTAKGSMVIYGNYESPDDPQAQADLKRIKNIALLADDHKPLAAAYLTPIEVTPPAAQLHPFDLRTLRRQHPRVNPLYTLDIAVWIASESDGYPWTDMKRASESYASQLRAQNIEAYFFHDENKQVTQVTVGKFDRTAIDSRSGFFSAGVRQLMEKFPVRLNNGEDLLEPVNRRDPNSKMKPQESRLVQVPSL